MTPVEQAAALRAEALRLARDPTATDAETWAALERWLTARTAAQETLRHG